MRRLRGEGESELVELMQLPPEELHVRQRRLVFGDEGCRPSPDTPPAESLKANSQASSHLLQYGQSDSHLRAVSI